MSAAKEEDKETKRRRTTTESSHRTKPVSACAFVLLHSWHLAKQHPPLRPSPSSANIIQLFAVVLRLNFCSLPVPTYRRTVARGRSVTR